MRFRLPASHSRSVPLLPTYIYGAALAFVCFGCIRQGWLSHPLLERYIMGHPVSLVETMMFCVGIVALSLKAWQLLGERKHLQNWQPLRLDESLDQATADPTDDKEGISGSEASRQVAKSRSVVRQTPAPDDDDPAAVAGSYLKSLSHRPAEQKCGSIGWRIEQTLRYIQSRQSAQGIDTQLKHLAVQDADAQHDSYSLIRLMVWAIPMLGFLGTVLGISEALGGLNLGADADLSVLIDSLKSSLNVAFDTTALALAYGVVLMFIQFGLDRVETGHVRRVDATVEDFVLGTFSEADEKTEQPSRAISRMGQALLKATFSLVEHQHELWNDSLVAAQDAWISATENSVAQSEVAVQRALSDAGNQMADKLSQALEMADHQLQHRAQQWQVSLSDNSRAIAKFQENAATHIQLLEQFFQQCSHLSTQQQNSLGQLIGNLDRLIVQNHEIQAGQIQRANNQEQAELAGNAEVAAVLQAHAQETARHQAAAQAQLDAEREARLAGNAEMAAVLKAHSQETARHQAAAQAQLDAEREARLAAEARAEAEAQARAAAENLATAEAFARQMAEQQAVAAAEAKLRADELALSALAARRLAEKQLLLEAENRRLSMERSEAPVPTAVSPVPTAVSPVPVVVSPVPVVVASTKSVDSTNKDPMPADELPAPPKENPVNSQVRSQLLPFPDAKIYRAA